MKSARHEKIIELIQEYDIDTQEELAARLNEAGFKVTQATVSIDIRALKLMKVAEKMENPVTRFLQNRLRNWETNTQGFSRIH